MKNASAIPLRAAYLHGPYTLYAACYPSTFDPNYKDDKPWQGGVPDFEPNLRAGGTWHAKLKVPENIRQTAGKANVKRTTSGGIPSFTWIIEISSQVVFSNSAVVHFELLVGRDEKSLDLSYAALGGTTHGAPGQLQDHQQGKRWKEGHGAAQPNGVYSKAVDLVVDDTASLWNKPPLPEWNDEGKNRGVKGDLSGVATEGPPAAAAGEHTSRTSIEMPEVGVKKRKKVHLVVLTHGLHSNLGADMLYLKESIDATAKQAREDARKRRAQRQQREGKLSPGPPVESPADEGRGLAKSTSIAPLSGGQEDLEPNNDASDDNEEEVIVRGFSGNAVRTERGIQYLGKRLAKYVLTMTYPDQPFLPVKKSVTKAISRTFAGQSSTVDHRHVDAHPGSTIHKEPKRTCHLAYKITSISFVAHSLGGLVQTYAIAYIHKHSPHFFEEIKPINFVALATPFLGLSNENPIYVKFALDFGLVGRTGQDLGLTWRAPAVVRSGWGAVIGGIGAQGQRAHRNQDPGSKPLLRVLPTGPAHQALKMFRNRTVYSNVVNDGIVPLRTSCLLFLDWRGLDRVEKARRENGLVGTMAGWGWAELIGANSSSHRPSRQWGDPRNSSSDDENNNDKTNKIGGRDEGGTVPQPSESVTNEDTLEEQAGPRTARLSSSHDHEKVADTEISKDVSSAQQSRSLSGLFSFLRPHQQSKSSSQPPKRSIIYNRSQTTDGGGAYEADEASEHASTTSTSASATKGPAATRGDSSLDDPNNVLAPPKTSFFESAGDILNPPLPSEQFIVDPSSRPRTIFHDRVYHPEDIPTPPPTRSSERGRPRSGSNHESNPNHLPTPDHHHHNNSKPPEPGTIKVEEKIARAYHRDLSWRKVLVRLEPDAHNNMVVRRMFSNAYGWPVIKHLVDTHFADTYAATTEDTHEDAGERARPMHEGVSVSGEEGSGQSSKLQEQHVRTESERREARDKVPDLPAPTESTLLSNTVRPRVSREDSIQWDDAFFEVTDDEDDLDTSLPVRRPPSSDSVDEQDQNTQRGTSEAEIDDFLNAPQGGKHSPGTEPSGVGAQAQVVEDLHGGMVGLGLRKSVEEQVGSRGSVSGLLGSRDGR